MRPVTNVRAARIGPTVCELDGPMPTLKRSKTLIMDALPSPSPPSCGLRPDGGRDLAGTRGVDAQPASLPAQLTPRPAVRPPRRRPAPGLGLVAPPRP